MDPEGPEAGLVEGLFRREYGRITAALARYLGPARLGLAEDIAQETLLRALRTWRYGAVPDDPAAWLFTVARRIALDHVRRDAMLARHAAAVADLHEPVAPAEAAYPGELADDEVRLLFMCAHPALSPEMRLALILKVGCGLSPGEIAAGLLKTPAAVAQWIVRAKRRIRDEGLTLDLPEPAALGARLTPVLDAIYLAFAEGHAAAAGDTPLRADVCTEALRLAEAVASHAITGRPEAQALAALLLFNAARLPTRVDATGDATLLADQDRTRWDQRLIARGFTRLARAATGERLSEFHLLAGIAAEHARAPSFEATDWTQIRGYYDLLIEVAPTPLHRLNRAVALAMPDRPERGLAALDALSGDAMLAGFHTFHTVRGELLRRAGDGAGATRAFAQALDLAPNEAVRRFLKARLD